MRVTASMLQIPVFHTPPTISFKCYDAHEATCQNLRQNMLRMHRPLARPGDAVTMTLAKTARTCARTGPEYVPRVGVFRMLLLR